jgi:sensor domain CHASE-containing protein
MPLPLTALQAIRPITVPFGSIRAGNATVPKHINASSGKLLQTVIVPIAALVALAMGVVVAFIWFSASTQDRIAFEKSVEAVQTAIERRQGAIGANVTDYAWWNDAVEHLDLSLDEAWADINIGAYQYETYEIELSLVVDRSNRTIFVRLDGEPAEIDAFQILPGGSMS